MSELTYLAHHGTKGMKWGQRRYQNSDGSLTALGRARYGVGAARTKASGTIKKIGTAIRKKVAPTNAELNAQIRKQRSKNLNAQKRAELKELKKGHDPKQDSKSKASGTHKKYYEMTDKEIQERINRLTNEVKLADLEFQTSLTPGQRFIYGQVKNGLGEGIKNVTQSAVTKAGKSMFGLSDDDGKKKGGNNNEGGKKKKGDDDTEATKEYRRKTNEINARAAYEKAKADEDKKKAEAHEAAAKKKADAKKAAADDFSRVRENVSQATAGYRERYEAAHTEKEKTQKANVYSEWDPDERKRRIRGYLG